MDKNIQSHPLTRYLITHALPILTHSKTKTLQQQKPSQQNKTKNHYLINAQETRKSTECTRHQNMKPAKQPRFLSVSKKTAIRDHFTNKESRQKQDVSKCNIRLKFIEFQISYGIRSG